MGKTGRNNPCPCGSGKKYKYCCYDQEIQRSTPDNPWGDDEEWFKIRLTEVNVITGILKFVASHWPGLIQEAADEFWGDYPADDEQMEAVFIPWVVFNFIPEPLQRGPSRRPFPEQQFALEYLNDNVEHLDEYQIAFIISACGQPFSFFAVTSTVPGKSLDLRDIFLERTFTVKEARASRTLRRGDIIFARVLPLEGQAILLGMGTTGIPPRLHASLLDIRDGFKKEMQDEGFDLDLAVLLGLDFELRDIYWSIADLVANPRLPELQNTDGDPISFVKLYFELRCSPQEAFNSLRPLALSSQNDVPEDATLDENGDLLEVSFDWLTKGNKRHKNWENTILGSLKIKDKTLTAEVNSEKRAKKIQSEVKKRLGDRAVFKRAVHESVEAKLEEFQAQAGTPEFERSRKEQDEFASRPEVQAALQQQMKAHWENWYNEPVPALQNNTPLEAARTKAGRERLEALLLDFERRNEDATQPYLQVDIEAMRRKLGLTDVES